MQGAASDARSREYGVCKVCIKVVFRQFVLRHAAPGLESMVHALGWCMFSRSIEHVVCLSLVYV